MRLLEHHLYHQNLINIGELSLPWERLQNTTVMITGATGMIGHFLIDVLMYRNQVHGQQCNVYTLGRSIEKAKDIFREYWDDPMFHFIHWNFEKMPMLSDSLRIDYLFHLASTTHPKAYATEAIDTIMINVLGLRHLLDMACQRATKRVIFTSSCEIYGNATYNTPHFVENSCGYIDCNTLRAGYPESKRTGEALCQAYIYQKGLDIVIPRLSRTFGPTMLSSDTKAVSQFIKRGVSHEDIVLKSKGTQVYSYSYVADAVSGILVCLFFGACGSAYNISSDSITLKELAQNVAEYVGSRVIFALPNEIEKTGYSKASYSVLDNQKLKSLGWSPQYEILSGIRDTIQILSSIKTTQGEYNLD